MPQVLPLQFVDSLNTGILLALSERTQHDLVGLVQEVTFTQQQKSQDEEALSRILALTRRLPEALRSILLRFDQSRACYLLIKNLPETKHDELLLAITHFFGLPFAHEDEGALVMMNKPRAHEPSAQVVAYYTWNRFDLHTELPYIQFPPDYIALWSVHNVAGGFTYVASVERALALMTTADIEELSKPQFLIPIPPHFGEGKTQKCKRPLLTRDGLSPCLRVRFDGLVCDTEAGRRAVDNLQIALDSVREAYELEPNSLLIINNRLTAHGRAPFLPTFGDKDRELHRVYITSDVAKYGPQYDPMTRRIKGF